MSPPKIVWMLAPKLPMTERERTTTPRTVPSSLATRWPASVKAVVFCMAGDSAEFHLRSRALRGVLDLEELRLGELKHAGVGVGRETFAGGIVGSDGVVVGLAGEGDL